MSFSFAFRLPWGWMEGCKFRVRTSVSPTIGEDKKGGSFLPPGTIVKCVMTSGMGDVGVTTELSRERGYDHRALPYELEKIEEEEYPICSSKLFNRICEEDKRGMFQEIYSDSLVPWDHDVLKREWWE